MERFFEVPEIKRVRDKEWITRVFVLTQSVDASQPKSDPSPTRTIRSPPSPYPTKQWTNFYKVWSLFLQALSTFHPRPTKAALFSIKLTSILPNGHWELLMCLDGSGSSGGVMLTGTFNYCLAQVQTIGEQWPNKQPITPWCATAPNRI